MTQVWIIKLRLSRSGPLFKAWTEVDKSQTTTNSKRSNSRSRTNRLREAARATWTMTRSTSLATGTVAPFLPTKWTQTSLSRGLRSLTLRVSTALWKTLTTPRGHTKPKVTSNPSTQFQSLRSSMLLSRLCSALGINNRFNSDGPLRCWNESIEKESIFWSHFWLILQN